MAQLSHQMMRGKLPPCPLCTSATEGQYSQLPTFLYGSLSKKQVPASLFQNLGGKVKGTPQVPVQCKHMAAYWFLWLNQHPAGHSTQSPFLKTSQPLSSSPGPLCLAGGLADASPSLPSWGGMGWGLSRTFSLGWQLSTLRNAPTSMDSLKFSSWGAGGGSGRTRSHTFE